MSTLFPDVEMYRRFDVFDLGENKKTVYLFKVTVGNGRKEYFASMPSQNDPSLLNVGCSYFGIEPRSEQAAILSEAETDNKFHEKVVKLLETFYFYQRAVNNEERSVECRA